MGVPRHVGAHCYIVYQLISCLLFWLHKKYATMCVTKKIKTPPGVVKSPVMMHLDPKACPRIKKHLHQETFTQLS